MFLLRERNGGTVKLNDRVKFLDMYLYKTVLVDETSPLCVCVCV